MTNNEVIASAKIFAICRNALDKRNEADVSNAQRFPLRFMTQYIKEAHTRGKVTSSIDKQIATLMDEIDEKTMEDEFDKCLTLEQQGAWIMAFMKMSTGE